MNEQRAATDGDCRWPHTSNGEDPCDFNGAALLPSGVEGFQIRAFKICAASDANAGDANAVSAFP
ncbi:hypothetical protein [Schaalia hyovaginalis]|uniref:hypothetical protein n=1 Tax=Schaalia hyovaginalis TaxID=29316 RepID=UPI002A754A64|nr:hypothetical protein [Schaalia hyovaginalis]MDY2668754.1 hypothetical protein [Schaalia hyovaginalis]